MDNKRKETFLCNVGINDAWYKVRETRDGVDWKCPYYSVWGSMITRCYSKKFHDKCPTYKDCIVDKEWLRFSVFRKWMECQDWEGKCLDKDILFPSNRVYSADKCIFIEIGINSFLSSSRVNRGKYPLGVTYNKSKKSFFARCHNGSGKLVEIGKFACPNEAHEAYRQYKHKLACKYADEQTDPRIAHALRQWYKPNGWYLLKEEQYGKKVNQN